jgi:hypothetical protein
MVKTSITYNLYLIQPIEMAKEDRSEVIEQGDMFFFYRPKVDAEEVENIKDVQRFYMVTSAKEKNNSQKLLKANLLLKKKIGH